MSPTRRAARRAACHAASRACRLVPLVVSVTLLALSVPAAAHAYLDASTPDAHGWKEEGSSVVALRFTERIDSGHTRATVADARGTAYPSELDFPAGRPSEMRVVTEPLAAGDYVLSWRAVGIDGHAASGSFLFHVGPSAAPGVPGTPHDPADPWSSLEASGRALFVAGIALVTALPVFCSEVAQVVPPRRIRMAMLVGAGAASSGAILVAYAVTVAAEVPFTQLTTVAGGRLAAAKMVLCLTAGAAALVGWRRPAWLAAAALPAFLALTLHAMGGHGLTGLDSAEGAAGHIAMTVHLVAAALWAGGLAALLLLLPGTTVSASVDVVHRFLGLAVVASVAVALTGLYEAYVHVPGWGQRGPYVGLLVAKAALLAVLVALGAVHAFAWRPRAGGRGTRTPWTLVVEAGVMVAVIVAAGLLASVPAPSQSGTTDGPRAVVEDEGPVGDFLVRFAVAADPLRAGTDHELELRLLARTSRPAADAQPEVWLVRPSGDGREEVRIGSQGDGAWTARLSLGEAGVWGLTVQIGADHATFPLRVLPAHHGG